jgi:hypothetical protein
MPTFDGGHYFLTALVPIRTDTVGDGLASTSPVHALSKRLDMLAPTAETPALRREHSPFEKNKLNHFARFVIIEDVEYNGREHGGKILSLLDNLLAAQPQDHLSCPFLLFAAEFDAKSGADGERDSYLAALWHTMGDELRHIFRFCQGFDGRVKDEVSFAKYIADCQLQTTMSFNDYYVDSVDKILIRPAKKPLWVAAIIALGLIGALVLVVAKLFMQPLALDWRFAIGVAICVVGALVIALTVGYVAIMATGSRPFPAAPDSGLPTVLKSLHLQRAFTHFAIASQMQAVGTDAASAQKLYDDFAKFIADNKPSNLDYPTQAPGVIGI